jgi:CcmD family protein
MRDLIIGYIFIFAALLGFLVSLFQRSRRLQKRVQDLKEELRDSNSR